jgi:hypothetical protein
MSSIYPTSFTKEKQNEFLLCRFPPSYHSDWGTTFHSRQSKVSSFKLI